MRHGDFEAGGSPLEVPRQWYDTHCHERFSEIEPNSNVGGLVLAIALERDAAEAGWDILCEQIHKGTVLSEERLAAVSNGFLLAFDTYDAATQLYGSIAYKLRGGETYDKAITFAAMYARIDISRNSYPDPTRKEKLLEAMAALELAFNTDAEYQHFQDLAS